jgi:hypothetical protein
MDNNQKELWDQLDGETERAFGAFQAYMSLPSRDRTVLLAYQRYVGNASAIKVSDTWSRWSRQFAWRERAAAHDTHLDRIRERSIEKAIAVEAEKQAREAEKTRYRYHELMTNAGDRAMQWLEGAQRSDLRAQDVIRIIKLHLDAVMAFEATEIPRQEDTWTEQDEIEIDRILREIEERESPEEEDW